MNTHTDTRKTVQHDLFAICRCGQDLEFSTRAHCPRCGTSVRKSPVLLLAA